MSKRISVVFCLMLAVAMAFSLLGCAQPAADSAASSAPSGDASASTEAGSGETITLEF